MKGTIVTIDKAGSYNDMEINEVTFKHGEKIKFFIKKTDRNPNGDLVNNLILNGESVNGHTFEYELTPTGNGKIIRENNFTAKPKFNGGGKSYGVKDEKTQNSILMQVCFKECMQAFAKENEEVVLSKTLEYFYYLRNELNNL